VVELKRSARGSYRRRLPSDTAPPLGGWQECVRGSRVRVCLDDVDADAYPPPPPPPEPEPVPKDVDVGSDGLASSASDAQPHALPNGKAAAGAAAAATTMESFSAMSNGKVYHGSQRNGRQNGGSENGEGSPGPHANGVASSASSSSSLAKGQQNADVMKLKRRRSSGSSDTRSDTRSEGLTRSEVSARGKRSGRH
jgi:hypothetical protein